MDDGTRRTAKPRDRRHTKIGHDKSPPGQETESRLGVRCFGTQSRAGWATGPMTLLGPGERGGAAVAGGGSRAGSPEHVAGYPEPSGLS